MRFTQASLLLASAIGLSQSLALPKISPAVEVRSAASQLHKVFARAFECDIEDKEECTTCPPILFSPEPNAAKAPRAEIPINAIGEGAWGPGNSIETHGLSVCTVMATWDETQWIMAHIPPAREGSNGQLAATGQDLINEYLRKMDERWRAKTWNTNQGYLLVSTYLAQDLRNQLKTWFTSKGIALTFKAYSPEDVVTGSGNLVISREAQDFPPMISLL